MEFCTQCGHRVAGSRFCTACGAATDGGAHRAGVEDTAERRLSPPHPVDAPPPAPDPAGAAPMPPPTVPLPPLTPPPSAPRYPLYADEAAAFAAPGAAPPGPPPAGPPPTSPPPEWASPAAPAPPTGHSRQRRGSAWLPLVVGALVLVVVLATGVALLLGDGDDAGTSATDSSSDTGAPAQPSEDAEGPGAPGPSTDGEPSASAKSASPDAGGPLGAAEDVTARATVVAPATAPPNEDVEGDTVTYDAANMLDGVAGTCWRMPGDGTGSSLEITLAGPTVLTEVGLVNGYAKRARTGDGSVLDWYAGNRRILAVQWELEDGTVLSQDLAETPRLQTIPVPRVTTSTLRLHLVEVTGPGSGPASRDYTAISDLSLVGVPAA